MPLPPLEVGRTYSWDELASLFSFKESYLGAAGGMVSRPEHDALLLITHPGGGRSFDYEDYWDGGDLIYTGRGKTGDQSLDGQNGEALLHESSLARTMPTDRILTCRCDTTLVGQGRSSDSGSHSRG